MGVGRGPVGGTSSNDYTAPYIQNLFPANGSEQTDKNTPITFDVFDYGDNVDQSSIVVMVNGDTVLSSNTFYLGWTGSITRVDFGYHVQLNPNITDSGRVIVNIDARALDSTGFIACAEWSYVLTTAGKFRVLGLSGPLDGGTIVRIFNSGVSNRKYEVDFSAGLTTRWSGVDTGSSAYGVTLPTTSSVSPYIANTYESSVFDATINYTTDLRQRRNFVGTSVVCEMRTYVDENTYCSISNVFDAELGQYSRTVIYDSGVKVLDSRRKVIGSSSLTIRRNARYVEMYSGSTLVSKYSGWTSAPSKFKVSASTTAMEFTTTLTSFEPKVVVLFDNNMADASVEYLGGLISVHSPRYNIPRVVEMRMRSFDAGLTLDDGFEYIEPPRLTVSNNNSSVRIENDKTLRDTSSALKGLRV